MTLPDIKIPIELPSVVTDAVPLLIHPVFVHFAVVLPLIVLILELVNMIMKRRSLTVSIYTLFILGAIIFAGAYLSGITDGSEAGPLLSAAGQEELKCHKNLGTLLLYLTLVPMLFKILSVMVKKVWAKMLYILLLIAFVALTLFQAKEGGELVYEHGANVQAVQVAEDRIEELEDKIDELKSANEEKAAAPESAVEEEVHEKVEVDLSEAAPADEVTEPEAASQEQEVSAPADETVKQEAASQEEVSAPADEEAEPAHAEPEVETSHADEPAKELPGTNEVNLTHTETSH